jgi:regulator of replication initiation timing
VLIEAIKDQQKQIESTNQENQQLKLELDELKALVNTLIANQTAQVNKQ